MALGFDKGEMKLVLTVKDDGSAVISKFGDNAEKNAKKGSKAFADFSSGAGLNFRSIAAYSGMAAAALVVGAGLMIKSQIDVADATGKLADKLGTTSEAISALAYAAETTANVSRDDLGQALVTLSRNLSDAAQGAGDARFAIKDLGLDAQALARMRPEQAVAEIAAALQKVTSQNDKIRITRDLFGNLGPQLLAALKGGPQQLRELADEAQRLGLIIETDTAKRAAQFNDNITTLKHNLVGLANKVLPEVTMALVDMTDRMLGQDSIASLNRLKVEKAELVNTYVKLGLEMEKYSITEGLMVERRKKLYDEIQSIDDRIIALEKQRMARSKAEQASAGGTGTTPNSRAMEEARKKFEEEFKALNERAMSEVESLNNVYEKDVANLKKWLTDKQITQAQFTAVSVSLAREYRQKLTELTKPDPSLVSQYGTPEQIAAVLADEAAQITAHYNNLQLGLDAALSKKDVTEEEYRELTRNAELQHQMQMAEIQNRGLTDLGRQAAAANRARSMMWQAAWKGDLASMQGVMGEISNLMTSGSKRMFQIGKTAALAQAAISMYLSIQNALATQPFLPVGLAMAAVATANGIANIAKIKSTEFGSSAATPTYNANPGTGLPTGGSGYDPAFGPSTATSPGAASDQPQVIYQTIVQGHVFTTQDFVDSHLWPRFYDNINKFDKTIMEPNSRNAQNIAAKAGTASPTSAAA